MVQLDHVPNEKEKDKRFAERNEAFQIAQESLSIWRKVKRIVDDSKALELYKNIIATTALAVGFFSVWMTVFSEEPEILLMLIEKFPNTRKEYFDRTGHPMEIGLSEEILGRTFDGIGKPIDRMGPIDAEVRRNVNGLPLNPVTRKYPRNYIHTGISAIDGLTTLIRGQKLPIFSGNGLPHDQLAAQIVQQASLGDSDEKFAIVFAAMGVKYDVAEFFRRTFEESGVSDHVVMFLNLANDPVVERLITPKVALTAAEYLAFEKGMHILVILTDITSFCEAMREVSSSRGEIPVSYTHLTLPTNSRV